MKTVTQHIRSRLLPPLGEHELDLKTLRRTCWCQEFENGMRNRLIQGRFRYGKFPRTKRAHDYLKRIKQIFIQYAETGNIELLIDLGNYAMLEYSAQRNAGKVLISIDDSIHAEKINE